MIKINKAGWIYIVLTILIGFAAVNTGNNLIYLIASALLSYMLVSGIFGRHNLKGVDLDLDVPEEVFAKTEIPVSVRLLNQKRVMPAFLINAAVGEHHALFPFAAGGAEAKRYCNMQFGSRGEHLIENAYVYSVFPFNFFTRYRRLKKTFKMIVLPRPQPCETLFLHEQRSRSRGEASTLTVGYDSDIISIRDYNSGDPLKYINWKSTAKTGVLKTKELSAVQLQHVLIDFDKMDKQDLENKISCITYLILKCIQSSIPVGLIINGEKHKPAVSRAHKITLLRKLAVYGQN